MVAAAGSQQGAGDEVQRRAGRTRHVDARRIRQRQSPQGPGRGQVFGDRRGDPQHVGRGRRIDVRGRGVTAGGERHDTVRGVIGREITATDVNLRHHSGGQAGQNHAGGGAQPGDAGKIQAALSRGKELRVDRCKREGVVARTADRDRTGAERAQRAGRFARGVADEIKAAAGEDDQAAVREAGVAGVRRVIKTQRGITADRKRTRPGTGSTAERDRATGGLERAGRGGGRRDEKSAVSVINQAAGVGAGGGIVRDSPADGDRRRTRDPKGAGIGGRRKVHRPGQGQGLAVDGVDEAAVATGVGEDA